MSICVGGLCVCLMNIEEYVLELHLLIEQKFANVSLDFHHLAQCGDLSSELALSVVLFLQIDSSQIVNQLQRRLKEILFWLFGGSLLFDDRGYVHGNR